MAVFDSVRVNCEQRIRQARLMCQLAEALNRTQVEDTKVLKGASIVLLYGALEYSLTDVVSLCIDYLNQQNLKVADVQPSLWALMLNPDCCRMEGGISKKWTNRHLLFDKIAQNIEVNTMSTSLFPTLVGNIKIQQIQGIWNTFNINDPVEWDLSLNYKQIISTIADCRMKIAHGRETAANIGGQYTIDEIKNLISKMDAYCAYLIECFERYIAHKDYLV